MGGGALMTPILVLLFKIQPLAAVSSDLVAAMVMNPVGSGSLIIVSLLLLYPMLASRELVGTDLVQAIPLVASAALGHILFGDFQLSLTASVLVGSLPGVYLGAKLSSRAPDGVIRPALVFVLLASGLKLLDMGTTQLAVTLAVFAMVGLPVWGVIDAVNRPDHLWRLAGLRKQPWVLLQALGAPFGVGFGASVAYFAGARRKLATAAKLAFVSVWGDELPAA